MPCRASGQNEHPEASAWGIWFVSAHSCSAAYLSPIEHFSMTKLNPPMGFTSRDWSEEMKTDKPTPKAQLEHDGSVLKEEPRFRGPVPIPIPLSTGHGRTLDWSRTEKRDGSTDTSVYLNSIVHRERLYAIYDTAILTERFMSQTRRSSPPFGRVQSPRYGRRRRRWQKICRDVMIYCSSVWKRRNLHG